MAAIALEDLTRNVNTPGEGVYIETFITDALADSGDTIDVSTVFTTIYGILNSWDVTDEDAITATSASGVITLDAAGGTTDHQYVVTVMGVKAQE